MRITRTAAALLLVFMFAGSTGCGKSVEISADELWQLAMEDAVFSEDSEVMELVKLTKEDERVIWDEAGERALLLTWHDYEGECPSGEPVESGGEIWATSAGEMIDWYRNNRDGVDDWEKRFAGLLGVHEDEGYTRVTGFWVSPEDVIRPAYITDVTKDMVNDYGAVSDPSYKEWFDGNIIYSYFQSDYPWTRLGYTYDWVNDETEYGLTEFLIFDSSRTEVSFTLSTEDFVSWLDEQIS